MMRRGFSCSCRRFPSDDRSCGDQLVLITDAVEISPNVPGTDGPGCCIPAMRWTTSAWSRCRINHDIAAEDHIEWAAHRPIVHEMSCLK